MQELLCRARQESCARARAGHLKPVDIGAAGQLSSSFGNGQRGWGEIKVDKLVAKYMKVIESDLSNNQKRKASEMHVTRWISHGCTWLRLALPGSTLACFRSPVVLNAQNGFECSELGWVGIGLDGPLNASLLRAPFRGTNI